MVPQDAQTGPPPAVALKLAIVGRRNAGKSTFINSLAEAERVIVSEIPGTTRDSVDVQFEKDGHTILAIDTAGLRKKSSVADSIEFYSLARAERSIRRADVVLHFIDATEPPSQVDKQLEAYILSENKPTIIVVNKWDLGKGKVPTEEMGEYLRKMFPALDYVPIVFITAKNGKNVQRVLDLAAELHKQATARVPTGVLNRVVREAIDRRPPPLRQNRTPRVYYATQVSTQPPTIVIFCNGPDLFDDWYTRYLLRQFRDHLPFTEVPIKIEWRLRGKDESAPPSAPAKPRRGKREKSEATPAPPAAPRRKKKPEPAPDVWRDV
jgi:GTP-binding protein